MTSELKDKAELAKKRAFSLFDEFKAFAFKGNVIDLAIGIVIGAAFGKIVDSFVKNVLMPLIGAILPGEQGYLGWKLEVNGSVIPYGLFLGEVVNFLIVAFAIFLFLKKFLGWVIRNREQETLPPPPLSKDQDLLTEIRDLLKAQVPK
jgi:large conductance mechanosensitive channel